MIKIGPDKVSPFLSYLQKRMDFIAQVATSAPSWCLLTDFDTLIEGFTKQYCLVKNIVRSHQGVKGGPDFEPLLEKRYSRVIEQAPQVDVPHGEIGAQAFYTILENIVRNTAKYGDPDQLGNIKAVTGDGKLRFTIAVHDQWDDGKRGWAQDYYKVQIVDNLESSPATGNAVVEKLNGFFSEYLTDPVTGVVKPKNWGMKEIKICAAYLRMVKQDQIDLRFEQYAEDGNAAAPPIIEVSLEKIQVEKPRGAIDSTHHLTYTFYLLRPKQALVVIDDPVPNEEELRAAGIDFFPLREFLRRINQGARPRHTFAFLPKPQRPEEWTWLWRNLNFLPPRVVIRDCTESEVPPGRPQLLRTLAFSSGKLRAKPAAFMDMLWTSWVNRWWGNYQILVRDSRHGNTVAELGYDHDFDEPEKVPPGNWLVFDHREAQDQTRLFEKAAYHQGFGHQTPTEQLLKKGSQKFIRDSKHITSEMVDNQTRLRIKEGAGLSVAVIDERVWLEKDGIAHEGIRHYASETSRYKVWRKRRVFLQDANQALDNFPGFVENLDPPEIKVFDFIIIHQGIIDSVRDKEKENFSPAWRKLKNRARWMVIDSGRGQPEQAREDELRWVEYSNLAECLVQYAGDKFRLAELLWTLRASAKNGGAA
jgi:hypothetical protein